MADKAIKRDTFETIEEAGWSAAKGAAAGGLLVVIPAAVIGAAIMGGGALLMVGAIGSVASLGVTGAGFGAAALSTTGLVLSGIAAVIGGASAAVGAASGASIFAAIGAGLGLLKGASKVSRENAMYVEKAKDKLMGKEAEMVSAHNHGMQMGYQTAMQQIQPQVEAYGKQAYEAGKQEVLNELQQHAKPASPDVHPQIMHEDKPQKAFAAAVTAEKAAAAAAGAQRGA